MRCDPLRYKLALHRARSCALAGTGSRSALALLLLWAALAAAAVAARASRAGPHNKIRMAKAHKGTSGTLPPVRASRAGPHNKIRMTKAHKGTSGTLLPARVVQGGTVHTKRADMRSEFRSRRYGCVKKPLDLQELEMYNIVS